MSYFITDSSQETVTNGRWQVPVSGRKEKTAYRRVSGLVSGHRYFSPEISRWTSRDPIGELGGVNLVAFSGNDLVNSIDILGLRRSLAECAKMMSDMAIKSGKLVKEIAKYDPTEDGKGEHKMKWGSGKTRPGGHYKEIMDLKRGIFNDYNKFLKECGCDDDPDDRDKQDLKTLEDLLNQNIPVPIYPNSWLNNIPGNDEFWNNVGIGAGVIGAGATVGVGIILAPGITLPVIIRGGPIFVP